MYVALWCTVQVQFTKSDGTKSLSMSSRHLAALALCRMLVNYTCEINRVVQKNQKKNIEIKVSQEISPEKT